MNHPVLSSTNGVNCFFSKRCPPRGATPNRPARLRFAVSDTGVGIAAETPDKVFEPFTQAAASTDREYGGSGLGLSISEGLVGLMGGG